MPCVFLYTFKYTTFFIPDCKISLEQSKQGLSVKYKGGGGSANYSKISQTEYKNKETQKRLLDVQSIYGLVYPKNKNEQLNISDSSITAADRQLSELTKWATKSGIMTEEEAKQLIAVGNKKGTAMMCRRISVT